jgi:hypothetical protein
MIVSVELNFGIFRTHSDVILLFQILLAVFTILLAKIMIYWRKINFIGDIKQFIRENLFLLATWKFPMIFSSSKR